MTHIFYDFVISIWHLLKLLFFNQDLCSHLFCCKLYSQEASSFLTITYNVLTVLTVVKQISLQRKSLQRPNSNSMAPYLIYRIKKANKPMLCLLVCVYALCLNLCETKKQTMKLLSFKLK